MAAFQVDDVMEGSGILKAQLAGHALKRSNEMGNCQESRNDPLTLPLQQLVEKQAELKAAISTTNWQSPLGPAIESGIEDPKEGTR